MGVLAVTVLVVLVGSGLCSGSETALLSVSEVRARQLAEGGSRRGRALLAIKQRIARPISAIVVLNNMYNIVGSIAVGVVAASFTCRRPAAASRARSASRPTPAAPSRPLVALCSRCRLPSPCRRSPAS